MPRLVVIPEELQHLRLLHIKPQRPHRDFELVVIHTAVLVCVEQLKGLFDFLALVVGELGAGVGAPFGFLGGVGDSVHGCGERERVWRELNRRVGGEEIF